jgi:hypothetical protein
MITRIDSVNDHLRMENGEQQGILSRHSCVTKIRCCMDGITKVFQV